MIVENIWQAIFALVAVTSLVLSVRASINKKEKDTVSEVKDDSDARAELDVKIKGIEERLEGQYKELTSKINGLEKALMESKSSNYTFETRILSSVDKLDSKLERIQDIVVKALINK